MLDQKTQQTTDQRFTARSVKEAMRKVRDELGPDAVILSQRFEAGFVEISASLEFPEPSVPESPASVDDAAVEAPHAAVNEAAKAETESSVATMSFENGTPSIGDPQMRQPDPHALRLAALGFTPSIIDQVLHTNPPLASWPDVTARLAAQLRVRRRPVLLPEGRIRLVGPPGSGKTTTIIKLAANHVLHLGAGNVVIITQDCNRLAGAEQLHLASELLGVPVIEAASSEAVAALLRDLNGTPLILLDTPGLDQADAAGIVGAGITPLSGVDTYLVVPATHQGSAIRRWARVVAPLAPCGIVLTHTDGIESWGETLSACAETRLGVSWIGTGSDLADGLESASSSLLVERALRPEQRAGLIEDVVVKQMAEVV